jgi:hypothetical protein
MRVKANKATREILLKAKESRKRTIWVKILGLLGRGKARTGSERITRSQRDSDTGTETDLENTLHSGGRIIAAQRVYPSPTVPTRRESWIGRSYSDSFSDESLRQEERLGESSLVETQRTLPIPIRDKKTGMVNFHFGDGTVLPGRSDGEVNDGLGFEIKFYPGYLDIPTCTPNFTTVNQDPRFCNPERAWPLLFKAVLKHDYSRAWRLLVKKKKSTLSFLLMLVDKRRRLWDSLLRLEISQWLC